MFAFMARPVPEFLEIGFKEIQANICHVLLSRSMQFLGEKLLTHHTKYYKVVVSQIGREKSGVSVSLLVPFPNCRCH